MTDRLPEVTVLLDDGTGAWATDLSDVVDLEVGYTITRGRGDESEQISPSTLSIAFTEPSETLALGQWIRVTETYEAVTSDRFTGQISEITTTWPDEASDRRVVQVTAVDQLASMSRQKFGAWLDNEVMVDDPLVYWPLREPEGLTFGDLAGKVRYPWLLASTDAGTSQDAPTAGGTRGAPTDGGVAVELDATKKQYLRRMKEFGSLGSLTSFTVEIFIYLPALPGAGTRFGLVAMDPSLSNVALDGFGIFVDSDGLVWVQPGTVGIQGGTLTPGFHHIAFQRTHGTPSAMGRIYIDGVEVATAFVSNDPVKARGIRVGRTRAFTSAIVDYFTGSVARCAIYDHTLGARITEHAIAGGALVSTESSGARIARYASYAKPVPPLALAPGVLSPVAFRDADYSDAGLVDLMQDVADSEGGLLFINGSGELVLQDRYHRAEQVGYQGGLIDLVITPDASTALTYQNVANIVSGTRPDGAEQTVRDDDSLDEHGPYADSLDLLVTTDAEVYDRINWELAVKAEPIERCSGFAIDMQGPIVQPDMYLGLEISDRIFVDPLPGQPGLNDQVIEGWTETVTSNSWLLAFNTTPWELNQAWVLEDSIYGVLESTTRLAY